MKKNLIALYAGLFILQIVFFPSATYSQKLVRFKDANGYYGFRNTSWQVIVPAKYNWAYEFKETLAAVKLNKWGYIDSTGKEVIPLKYDSAYSFDLGLAKVGLNQKWGFINKIGKEVVPLKFDEVSDYFYYRLARVKLNGKWGYVNKAGKEIIQPLFDDACNFTDGLACIKSGGKWGYIDTMGREIVPPKYDRVTLFKDGAAFVQLNGKWGVLNSKGKEVLPAKYHHIEYGSFMDYPANWFVVKLDAGDKGTKINSKGKELTFTDYSPNGYSEDLLPVEVNKKWGYLDFNHNEVIPMRYTEAYDFDNGLALVKLNDKWGYINKTGKEVIPIKYEDIKRVSNFDRKPVETWFKFKSDGKWGLLNKDGKEVIPAKFDALGVYGLHISFKEGLTPYKLNGKWGYTDSTGKEVIPAQYDEAYIFSDGKANVKKEGKTFKIDNPLNKNSNNQNGSVKTEPQKTTTEKNHTTQPVKQETQNNQSSVKLATPPLALKGKFDPAIVGLWKYTSADGKRTTYTKFNADGTYDYYTGAITTANKNRTLCYWRVDGAFMESVCEGAAKVERYGFQKSYAVDGTPTLTLGWAVYVPADNRTSW